MYTYMYASMYLRVCVCVSHENVIHELLVFVNEVCVCACVCACACVGGCVGVGVYEFTYVYVCMHVYVHVRMLLTMS